MSLTVNIVFLLTGLLPIALSSFSGDVGAHDPTFIRSGHCYYIFSTVQPPEKHGNPPIHRLCNDKSQQIGTMLKTIPKWIQNITKVAPHMWAPDVNFFNDQYYVYYVGSSFGSRNSVIAFATAKNVEGPYTDHGEVLRTTNALDYNAIDPEIAWTIENGKRSQLWLIFGSFWGGIKARRLDPKTGRLSHEDTKLYSLAYRPDHNHAVEAPSVAWRNGFYYLFVSFDICCHGASSTYRIMVGRSQHITGPYVDKNGVSMVAGGGTQLLATHGNVHGPGGCDVILDGNVYRMIYHWYDSNENGRAKYDIVDLVWSQDNWPSVGHQSKLNYH